MSQQTHYVTLAARDGLSQTFRQIGQTAQTAAQSISGTGVKVTQSFAAADQAADRLADSISDVGDRGGQSFSDMAGNAVDLSEAFHKVSDVLVGLGNAAEVQRQQVIGIGVAYGDSADEVLEFADAIQAATNYSNEAARAGALVASTLARNYGFTTDQLTQLVSVSADLSDIYGYDLNDTVSRLTAAMRGEAEAAEAVGLTLSETFVAAAAAERGLSTYTTTMTESEKAQFRFQVLLEQTTYAQGRAEKSAGTLRGQFIEMQHRLQDATTGMGQFVGPVGEVSAGIADLAIGFPVFTKGLSRLGEIAGSVSTKLGTVAAGTGALSRAAGVFLTAMGPVGLATGAAVLGIGALAAVVLDYQNAAAAAVDPTDTLAEAIERLTSGAEGDSVKALTESVTQAFDDIIAGGKEFADEEEAINARLMQIGQEMLSSMADTTALAAEEKMLFARRDAIDKLTLSDKDLAAAEANLQIVLAQTGPELLNDLTILNDYFASILAGNPQVENLAEITLRLSTTNDTAAASVERIKNKTVEYIPVVDDLSKSVTDSYAAIAQPGLPSAQLVQLQKDVNETELILEQSNIRDLLAELGTGFEGSYDPIAAKNQQLAFEEAQKVANDFAADQEDNAQQAIDDAADQQNAMDDLADEYRSNLVPAIEGVSGALADLVQPGDSALDVLVRIGGTAASIGDLAQELQGAVGSLDGLVNSIQGGLSKIEGAAGGATSIADALIGSFDDRADSAKQLGEIQEQYAAAIGDIERDNTAALKAAERDRNQELRAAQAERIDIERAAVKELRSLEAERRDVATETEEALRDMAEERTDLQVDFAKQAAEAEKEWFATSRDNLEAQAELRSELQKTTAEAAREWQQLNADNLAQQREIRETLQETLQAQSIDFKRTKQDIERERQRINEDLAYALADPNLTAEEAEQLKKEAARRIQDLNIQEKRLNQDHRREEKLAKEQAREQESALEADRKEALADFHATVREAEADTAKQIADLEADRLAAQVEYNNARQEAAAEHAEQLNELDQQETEILNNQAKRFKEIAKEQQIARRDAAREEQVLARDTAKIELGYQRDLLKAERERAAASRDAKGTFDDDSARALEAAITDLDRALAAGLITQGEYNRAVAASTAIQEDERAIQLDLATIRAQQLPGMAEGTAAVREQTAALRELNPQQQQIALYLQDTENAAKVAAAAATIYSGAINEIPREVATDIIASAADADPILADVLESYDLIEKGATGEITVNFDGKEAADGLAGVEEDVENLDGPVVKVIAHTDEATEALHGVTTQLDNMEERTISVRVNMQGRYAEGEGGAVSGGNDPIYSGLEGVGTALDNLESRVVKPVKITADTGAFWSAVRAITSRESVGSTSINVTADVSSDVAGVGRAAAADLAGSFEATLSLNTLPYTNALAEAQQSGDGFAEQTFTANLGAYIGKAAEGGTLANDMQIAFGLMATFADPETIWTATLGADNSLAVDAVDQVADKIEDLAEIPVIIGVKANFRDFWQSINNLRGDTVGTVFMAVDQAPTSGGAATATIDTSAVNTGIAEARAAAQAFAAETYVSDLDLSRAEFDSGVAAARSVLSAFSQGRYSAALDADLGDDSTLLRGALATAEAELLAYSDSEHVWVTQLDANNEAALRAIQTVHDKIDDLSAATATVKVRADLAEFWRTIRNINGDTVGTVFVDVQSAPPDTGGGGGGGTATGSSFRSGSGAMLTNYGTINVATRDADSPNELARQIYMRR